MATKNIAIPDELLPKLEELARAESRTADDLARDILEQYVFRRQAADDLERLAAWGQGHSKRMGYKPSDVIPAVAESRRQYSKR